MKHGYLSQYFKGVAAKTLSAVEADISVSNQHELNGVAELREIFGSEKKKLPTKFTYLDDNDDDPEAEDGFLTWYDARQGHATRTEYRLYFPTTMASACAASGDTLFVAVRPDDSALVVITAAGSTIDRQVRWLFGIGDTAHPGFSVREELETEQDRIAFASRFILDQIGIRVPGDAGTYLDEMLSRFGGGFPTTKVFSEYARTTLPDLYPETESPDAVLMAWLDREEILFRTLEKHLIGDKLSEGFAGDVEGFFKYSLSMHNRRKSRIGHSVENHVQKIFEARNVRNSRGKITENHSKPDFIFPSIECYRDDAFDVSLLTMLAAKSTCKDRWRQVLSEAERIKHKHLITLEVAISENQTDEMRSNALQLVVPRALHKTYTAVQQGWLMDFEGFISLVLDRQASASE